MSMKKGALSGRDAIGWAVGASMLVMAGIAQGAVGYASFNGSYSQDFNTLPYQAAAGSVQAASPRSFAPNTTVGANVTYTLPATGTFSLSDAALGTGSNPIASGMDGWWGNLATANRLGQNDGGYNSAGNGINFSGGVVSLGALGSSNRALGLVSSSTSGAATAALALRNDTGSAINSVTISLVAQLWTQQTNRKYLSFSYAVTPSSTITGNVSAGATIPATTTTDANLSPAFATAAYAVRDFSAPVSSGTLSDTLDLTSTPWGAGELLWLKWSTFNGGTFTAYPGGDGVFGTASGGALSNTSNAQHVGITDLTVAVPEPGTVAVAAVTALFAIGRRQRKN